MKEIGRGIYVEADYALVTVGAVLTDSGWVCIDTPPYPRDAHSWRAALDQISTLPIQYIVNTDHHRDRILGNIWFDAVVIAQARAAEAMLGLRNAFVSQAAEDMSANTSEQVEIANVKTVTPQIAFGDAMRIHCGGREIELTYHPSTSGANTWVTLADDRVIFAGDSVVTQQHPVITESASKTWLNSLWSLRQDRYVDWTIVPGRGPIEPIDQTETLSDYIRVARRRISSLIRSDRPRSDIGGLVTEFLPMFPYAQPMKEETARRIKVGLEAIYEELRNSQDDEGEV